MDAVSTGTPGRERYDGVGVDSKLRQRLSDMADEMGAKNTRVAIAVPVKEIISIFHDVYAAVPHVPDFDPEVADRRWGGIGSYSPGEVPDPQNEIGVRLTDDGVAVTFETFEAGGTSDDAVLALDQAEEFFLAGLSAVAEGKRRFAARPVLGLSDAEADAELLARTGKVIGSD